MIGATEASLAPILDLVCARIGHRIAAPRLPGVEAGVRRLMARRGLATAARLHELASVEPDLFDELVNEFVVTETYFFREPAQFEALRRLVLPSLAARRPTGELRIWSVGCATGEEAYSLAILLEQEGLAERAQILATDLSRHALATAREGVYSDWSLRGDRGGGFAARYFHPDGERWRVAERLRRRIRFEPHNLMAELWPSGPFDLILCRNVLIYFAEAEIARIAERLHACLAPGGWLVLGPSDPPLWQIAPYETALTEGGVFCRRDGARAGPGSRSLEGAPAPSQALAPAAGRRSRSAASAHRDPPAQAPRKAVIDAAGLAERARELANSKDAAGAERIVTEAAEANPTSAELQHLHAVVLLESGRLEAAAVAARRATFLDPSLLVGHLMLGAVMQSGGRWAEALRALRRAEALGAASAPDALVPLSNGETAAQLLEAARRQIAYITAGLRPGAA